MAFQDTHHERIKNATALVKAMHEKKSVLRAC